MAMPSSARAEDNTVRALLPSKASMLIKPKWHAPWKLYRVISGHTGWVRAVDVEPNNEWFATGGADRIVKVSEFIWGAGELTILDLGPWQWQAAALTDRSHQCRARSEGLAQPPVPLQCR